LTRSCRRQIALRVIAVDARRHAEPSQNIDSWRNDRGDVTGVRSKAVSGGDCSGGLFCGGQLCGLFCSGELLVGGGDDRVIMRMIGSFCMLSMSPCGDYAGNPG
jgi:hypothetical protein